ncbi:PAS domain S-box protein [Nostoc sp. CENA67]|uniref:histidine kinase n=1 Tax=Amazonocrinis nigriterrae CENA67 TaxID=2794033 RepID=A0A8J7HYM7_9NOST|nr:PAS domain S-box protein [Amazonocrinis nigriterrae]MBH8564899.1 PAS domain S-box protein [Amazonocrinis nigriterrae CENA67]
MAPNLITVDKNTYESLQQELIELRQVVACVEQAKSSNTLKYSQEHIDLFIEYTPAAIAMFDRQMRYLLASRRWREDYDLGNEEIIGRSYEQIFPEIQERWWEIHQRCLAGIVEKCEHTCSRADGTTDWVKWEIHPWYQDSGEVGGTIIFSEVISDRKLAEIALANSEKLLRNITAHIPGAIFQFAERNGVWMVDYISDFIWEVAGITATEIMQDFNNFLVRLHPEDFDSYIASVIEAVENATPWHYEGRLVKPNGEIRWWQGGSTSIGNEKGEIIFFGVLFDITERKQTEEARKQLNQELEAKAAALRQSEARLQRLADNVPGMLYEFRLQPDGTMSFSYVSSQCGEILGLEPKQVMGDASLVFCYIHPEDALKVQQAIAHSAQTLQNYELEWRVMTPFGQEKLVKGVSRPEPQPKGEIIWYGFLSDITEQQTALRDRQLAEEQLQQQAQFLQSIWEGVDYGIYVLEVLDDGAEFRYLKFNPAILRFSPIPLDNFVGKTMAEVLPVEVAHRYRQHYNECIKSGKSIFFEEFFLVEDKETWWLLNITPLLDSTKRISQLVITVTDITERKQTEQEKQMFVSLVENSSDFIGVATLDRQPMFINEAGRKLIGMDSLESVKSMNILDFFLPEDLEQVEQFIMPAVIKHGLWQGESRFKHFQTGEAIPVDYNMFVVRNPDTGEPLYFATITRDIRDRQLAEEQLQEQEQFLRTIYDGVEQQIFVINVLENGELRFAGWNLPTAQVTGISNAHVVGKTPEDLFGDVVGLAMRQRQQSCVDTGVAITYEESIILNNEVTWWLTTINPLKNSEGRIYRLIGTTFNITKRKQAEQALEASQHFIQRIADSSPNILYIFDLEQKCNVYANKEIATLLGYTIEEIQQMGEKLLPTITHPDDAENILEQAEKLLQAKDGDILELEFRVKQANGEWCWLYSRETPFSRTEDGKVKQVLGVSTNITERKQAEIKLQQQAENLENTLRELQLTQTQLIHSEKMSSLGNMVAGVAHEINNPINFIHANLIPANEYVEDLLKLVELYQEHFPYPPEEIQAEIAAIELDFLKEDLIKLLSSMRVGTQRIREIVLSLRSFSRLDEAEFKQVDIHEGIDSTLMILHNRLKAQPNHPEILVIKEYGHLPRIDCYPGQLNQVFMNLLSNAIDALEESKFNSQKSIVSQRAELASVLDATSLTPGNPSTAVASLPIEYGILTQPQIRIRTEVINSDRIIIRIADNGKGITPEILSKLFDPFFTTKDVGKGTGLGLSISYQIVVDKHHGKLYCQSTPGQGAEFIIEIPITQSEVPT